MRICVVGAVPAPDSDAFYSGILSSADAIVAADAGAALCRRLGIRPDLVVGDLDSLNPTEAKILEAAAAIERHPAAKDRTDLELAIEAARRLGADSLVVTAAFRDRPDHTLAAFGCLLDAADLHAEAREPGWTAWALDSASRASLTINGQQGAIVSVISPEGADGVSLDGFEFSLHDAHLRPLSGLGVSNVLAAPEGTVTLGRGRLLVVASRVKDEPPSAG